MDLSLNRNTQVFHLPAFLIDKLKELAAQNRSNLNEYVETLLLDAVYHEPNELTTCSFQEAKDGKLYGPIDTSSVEGMLKSMGL